MDLVLRNDFDILHRLTNKLAPVRDHPSQRLTLIRGLLSIAGDNAYRAFLVSEKGSSLGLSLSPHFEREELEPVFCAGKFF
jgi:hypothetical protein